jgi:hypothetical protein
MQKIFRKNVKYYKVGGMEYESKERNRKIVISVHIRIPLREEYKLDPKYNSLQVYNETRNCSTVYQCISQHFSTRHIITNYKHQLK